MSTATITSKGQITIPVEVRNDLKVDAGVRVEFVHIAPVRGGVCAVTSDITARQVTIRMAKKHVTIQSR